MDMKVILTPIIGAAIGYSTNWVAIKMLFRPYSEKRIMGVKVPFTPGLIPKERQRISNNIGEVIEEYLLTDKVIINELLADNNKNNILEFVNKYLYNAEGNININNFIAYGDSNILDKVNKFLADKVMDFLQEDENKQEIIDVIVLAIEKEMRKTSLHQLVNEDIIFDKYREFITSEKLNGVLIDCIDDFISSDKCISELIDEEVLNNIKGTLLYNSGKLIESVEDIFNNSNVKEKIVTLIDETIKLKVGALGAMFVNAESIYETIEEKSKEKLQEKEVQEGINNFISSKIDSITSRPLYEIMPEYTRNELITSLAKYIPDSILKIDISKIIDFNNQDIHSIITSYLDISLKKQMTDVFSSKYNEILNDNKTRQKVCYYTKKVMNNIIDKDIIMTQDKRQSMSEFIIDKYSAFVNTHMTELIEKINLSKIIEEQLNSFDIEMIEDIILSITKNELNAITSLGGLIGFIISLLALI
ncbi:MAG: DUF445 family protein [Vallitalea sp.]|jgi:uncharacterized membrane protein YheB (UPF0754 family)|nr:DUF445 family protein [Vallitalea sp.]